RPRVGMAPQGRNPDLSRRSRRVVVDVPAPIPLEALGSRRLSGTILPHLILRGINHLTTKTTPHARKSEKIGHRCCKSATTRMCRQRRFCRLLLNQFPE